ncbi:MAG: 50S ribosomal protein L15 [Coxiella sp. (in: Bacteria)]|nr:MAG: 50S ribosomal protein L15 [Coxiella sp. (in: g-proteobacteria)]
MRLNSIKPSEGATKNRRRKGRGIGCTKGKTCGRGHKGQKARSGGYHKVGFEGGQMPLQRRVPKFGFHSRKSKVTAEVRLNELNKIEGDVVDMAALLKANIITSMTKHAKIFLSGEVGRAVTVKGVAVTKGAKAAIEAKGGKIEA